MDIDSIPTKEEEEGQPKPLVVLLVGAPGSGKSTFCDHVMRASSSRLWVRVCQDIINNGKSGTKSQCLASATSALKDRKSVLIDRCNLDKEQRAEFVKLGSSQIDVHAIVLDLPAQLCISRSVKRTGHEGNLQGGKAAAVVNRMLQKKELPKLGEGYSRISVCRNENDVEDAIKSYSALGSNDILPSGYFVKKNPDAKVQVGIMKFLKKLDGSGNSKLDVPSAKSPCLNEQKSEKEKSSCSNQPRNEKDCGGEVKYSSFVAGVNENASGGDNMAIELENDADSPSCSDAPTLAFPSISTADFQFDLEKASEIIVEKIQEYLIKLQNVKLVLVDLTHKSRILSLVKAKAAQKKIDSNRFFTFVGDITQLYSQGGLRCNVIANAANWRLKPGGGGVNAAVFNAAGPFLKTATEKRAGSLSPGKAVVVPLPPASPLFNKEGVTHVIHVLGPNMNPNRPNYLNDNYDEGCRILRMAYSSLLEGFSSIVKNQSNSFQQMSKMPEPQPSEYCDQNDGKQENHPSLLYQKTKRDTAYELERNKKSKGNPDPVGGKVQESKYEGGSSASKRWGSWAQALYHIAMHPEKHEKDVLEMTNDVVVLNDLYPKGKKHIIVLARLKGLDCLADVRVEHLELLKTMHEVGVQWADKFIQNNSSLVFRLGYHSTPSMRQLHLHVISQDFDSQHLKNKKHWNTFTTAFFRDSVDVINEVTKDGKPSLRDEESLLSAELRCHRCRSAHPNIPRLKSHIKSCQAPYPQMLLEDGRLIGKPS